MAKATRLPANLKDIAKMSKAELDALAEARAADLVKGMFETKKMDELASYLKRGRALESSSVSLLQTLLVSSFRKLAAHQTPEAAQLLSDVQAEFSLRGIEPDYSALDDDLRRVRENITLEDLNCPAVQEEIKSYLRREEDEMN